MKIEWVDINTIIPYEKNAKKHNKTQIKNVAESIKEFGWQQPIVVDGNNTIIIGHCRFESAKLLRLKQVPITIADFDEKKANKLRLLDNKTNESEWDIDLLISEIPELDFGNYDVDWGLPEEEPDVEDDNFDVDEALNDIEEPIAKIGQVYKLGEHRLMCGDSTNENDVKKLMNNNKANMVFTDPPYGIDVVGENGTIGKGNKAKAGVYSKVIGDETTETAKKAYDILSRQSDKQILWGGNYFVDFLPFSDGWIIWDKRVDSPSNNFADGEMAWCNFHTRVRIYHHLWNGMIQEGKREKRVHPTQKPVKLIGDVLKDFTSEHDKILDGFGGSGSTLIACEQLNRKCYMMELDPKYVDVIIKRWEQYTGKQAELIIE